MTWDDIQQGLQTAVQSAGAYLVSPWFYLQVGVIIAAAAISLVSAKILRARFDLTSLDADLPGPLRVAISSLFELADAIFFALLASVTHVLLVNFALFSRGYLLATATSFAGAWIIIRLATGLIQNQFMVRVVSIGAWIMAALSIVGKLDEVAALLNSVSVMVGSVRVDRKSVV